jgi:hypothetical protein
MGAGGGRVFFESAAMNLTAAQDGIGTWDVFLRDLQAGVTELVSVSLSGTATLGNPGEPADRAQLCAITPDGRRVAFVSTATNLALGATVARGEVYVRDVPAGVTMWASRNVSSYFGSGESYSSSKAVLSADGCYVAFKSASSASPLVLVFRHDLETGATALLARNSVTFTEPAISSDGRYVAYETDVGVYVWDGLAGRTILASVTRGGTPLANGPSWRPVLAANGLSVAFLSAASDLNAAGGNGRFQVYVRDIALGATRLISTQADGTPSTGDLALIVPALSPDGGWVALDSTAADLGALDTNGVSDVFARQLGLLDTDGDLMDDDWELASFDSLGRDGTEDFDGDGMSDYDEFVSGTAPRDNGSVLRAVAGAGSAIWWRTAPGKQYKVQYRDSLPGREWTDLPGAPVVNGANAFQVDPGVTGQGSRFYRVAVGQ